MSEDDPDRLRERVRELEQTVDQQSETIASMLPGRRAILSGAVGASLGAGGMFYGSERASAQGGGQVGTSSNPVDVEAYNLNVQGSVSGIDTLSDGDDFDGQGSSKFSNLQSLGVEDLAADNVQVTQTTAGSLTTRSGDGVTVSGNSFQTIFDQSSVTDVIGGKIVGRAVDQLRVTWGDDSTDDIFGDRNAIGENANDVEIAVEVVPPIRAIKKLEFRHDLGSDHVYGWRVLTT